MTDFTPIRTALTDTFKDLRREGFVARQSFLCCRTCASAALDTPENQGRQVVYYTRQDRDDLEQSGSVYLAYGTIGEWDEENYEMTGKAIAQALHLRGLEVEWDGSASTRILVKGLLPPPAPEATYLDLVGATL